MQSGYESFDSHSELLSDAIIYICDYLLNDVERL